MTVFALDTNALLEEFTSYLADKIGIHFPKERWQDLQRKLPHIAKSFGFDDNKACMQWLLRRTLDQDEVHILAHHLSIGETYFFRDFHMFASLENKILPEILQRHQQDRVVRIWSAGCSSGEELYSIAIILHRSLPDLKEWDIRLFGTDINENFLKKAELGLYKKWSFRSTPQEVLERYFTKSGDGAHLLCPEIRNMAKFFYLNIVENNYPPDLQKMDLILCHNVLIYFSEKEIKKTISRFASALLENGWLTVSSVEVPFVKDKHFQLHNFHGAMLFKKEQKAPILQKSAPLSQRLAPKKKVEIIQKPIEKHAKKYDYQECEKLYAQKEYKTVVEQLLALLSHHKHNLDAMKKELLLLIRTLANQGDFQSALYWCDRALKTDPVNAVFHYLRATFCQDTQEAISSLKKALFLHPDFVMAYFQLGIFEKKRGNIKSSQRQFKTALELLQNVATDEILEGTEGLSACHLKELLESLVEERL